MAQLNKAQFLFLHEDIKKVASNLSNTYFQTGTLDEEKQPVFQFYGYGANWRTNFPSIAGILLKHRQALLADNQEVPTMIADEAFNGKYLYDRFTYTRTQENISIGENYLQFFLWFVQPKHLEITETWEQYLLRNELLVPLSNTEMSFSLPDSMPFLEATGLSEKEVASEEAALPPTTTTPWKTLALAASLLAFLLLASLFWSKTTTTAPIAYSNGTDTTSITWYLSNPWDGETSYMSELLTDLIQELENNTGGKFKVLVFNNYQLPTTKGCSVKESKELISALQNNEIQMLHSSAYYWKGIIPASIFFSSIPNGKNYEKTLHWLEKENGQDLCRQLYAPFNITPYSCGHTGEQYPGWFKDSIKSINDFKNMTIRIGGLGAEVLSSFGAKPKNVSQRNLIRYIASDSLDAVEWIAPYDDYRMGFHALKKFHYYYKGGWHEPNATNQMFINSNALKTLENKYYKGKTYRTILEETIEKYNAKMIGVFNNRNADYEKILKKEHPEIHLLDLPEGMLQQLRIRSDQIVEKYYQMHKNAPMMKEIYESYYKNR
jgi:TRAP-type mannitol/chloroaromatic compound transport system substrate-binding protein